MTSAFPVWHTAPTKHQGLLAWVQEVAELTQPHRAERSPTAPTRNTTG